MEDAFYAYREALIHMVHGSANTDLDSNYARFAAKALRIAMLAASLENNNVIELKHWALGQEICERWRANLHAVFVAINEPIATVNEGIEERIVACVNAYTESHPLPPTKRIISQRAGRGADSNELVKIIRGMLDIGALEEIDAGKTKRYRVPISESEENQG